MPNHLDMAKAERTREVWESCGRNARKAAKKLGISHPTVYAHLKRCKAVPAVSTPEPHSADTLVPLADEDRLWKAYSEDRSTENRNRLAEFYWPWLSKFVVRFCFKRRLLDQDFYGPASEALLHSIERFDLSRGNRFWTFFTHRLNGALLDACRDCDPTPRLGRHRQKLRSETEQQVGTCPEEVKQALNWSDEEYRSSLLPRTASLNNLIEGSRSSTFENHRQQHVQDVIGQVPRRELDTDEAMREILRGCGYREMVLMYLLYCCNNTMKQVGEMLDLSESRVSQMHKQVLERMRAQGWDKAVEWVEAVA